MNITQYGTIFSAVGCKLNFNKQIAELEVVEFPKGKASIIKQALEAIKKYESTAYYVDGISAPFLADLMDGAPNPNVGAREDVLTALGVMRSGRFIIQELALQKVNRSWHISEVANDCSYFGDVCTHRGVIQVEGKRGRKSTRQPNQFHVKNSQGITREQLVTPGLENMFRAIPEHMLVSNAGTKPEISMHKLESLTPEQIDIMMNKLEEVKRMKEETNV